MAKFIDVNPGDWRRAEFDLEQRLRPIGLKCVSAVEGVGIVGPFGLAACVLVVTTGAVWGEGAFCAVYSGPDHPVYWLTRDLGVAHADAISDAPGLAFWRIGYQPGQDWLQLVDVAKSRFLLTASCVLLEV